MDFMVRRTLAAVFDPSFPPSYSRAELDSTTWHIQSFLILLYLLSAAVIGPWFFEPSILQIGSFTPNIPQSKGEKCPVSTPDGDKGGTACIAGRHDQRAVSGNVVYRHGLDRPVGARDRILVVKHACHWTYRSAFLAGTRGDGHNRRS
jgi:hypothetical protein